MVVFSYEDWLEAGGSLPRDHVSLYGNSPHGLGLLREILPRPIIVVVKCFLFHHYEFVSILLNQVQTAAQV